MQFTLKIQRYDPDTEQGRLQEFTVDAPRDGDAARRPRRREGHGRRVGHLPQELPHGGVRVVRDADGRRGGAGLQGADGAAGRVGPRAGDLAHGQPAGDQGPGRRHGSVLGQVQGGEAVARGGRPAAGQGVARPAGGARPDHEGGALHPVRLLRLGVQLDGGRPRLPRPRGAGQGAAVRRRRPRPRPRRAPADAERRPRRLGLHPLLLLQRALPEGRRPARRDRQAGRRDLLRGDALGQGRPPRAGVRRVDPARPATCSRRRSCPTPTR